MSGHTAPLIEARDVHLAFGPTPALRGASVAVAPGLSWMKAAGGEAYRPVDGAIWVTNSTILRAALRSGSRSGL